MTYLLVKRCYDILFAAIAIIVLAPLFLIIILAIKIDSPGSVFFKQKRIGTNKSYFKIIKFRTMHVETPSDIPTHLLDSPEQWITIVGRLLRKTSLDELPQLINIIKGDMSFVGPRPALWNQDDLIAERDKYGANEIPVGLTGWAQVNGRDELPIEEKARLDGEYVNNIGLYMDFRCLFYTVVNVFQTKGVIEGGTGVLKKRDK